MHLDKFYNFCLKTFLNTHYLPKQMEETMILWVFDSFRQENQMCVNFHYDIRNQRVKICKYT